MNPTANSRYAVLPDGRTLIWNGNAWVQVTDRNGQPLDLSRLTYAGLQDGSWVNAFGGPAAVAYGQFSTNYGDIGPSAVRVVNGAPSSAQPYQGPGQSQPSWGQQSFQGASYQGLAPNGGQLSPAIVQLLLGQQGQAAGATITSGAGTLLAGASAFADSGAAMMGIVQGIALSLGVTTGSAAGAAGNSTMGLLISLLGTSGLSQVATAVATFNATAYAPASQALLNTAYDTFLTSFKAALATINNNAMVTGLLANGGSLGAVLGIMLAQNAIAAFNTSATATGGATIALLKTAGANLIAAWNAMAATMSTNSIIASVAA